MGGGWETGLVLVNLTEMQQTVQIDTYSGAKEPIPALTVDGISSNGHVPIALSPGQTHELVFASPIEAAYPGYLIVNRDGEGVAASLSYQGPFESIAIVGHRQEPECETYTVPFEISDRMNLGIALVTVDSGADQVNLKILDLWGHQLASEGVSVPSDGHSAFFITEAFEQVPRPMLGSLIIPAHAGLHPAALYFKTFPGLGWQLTNAPLHCVPKSR